MLFRSRLFGLARCAAAVFSAVLFAAACFAGSVHADDASVAPSTAPIANTAEPPAARSNDTPSASTSPKTDAAVTTLGTASNPDTTPNPGQSQTAASSRSAPVHSAITAAVPHGWVAVRDHTQQVTHLIHLPPRGVGDGRVELGTVRLVAGSPLPVDRLAIWSAGGGGGASSSDVAMILLDTPRGSRATGSSPTPAPSRSPDTRESKPDAPLNTINPADRAQPASPAATVDTSSQQASQPQTASTADVANRGNRLSRVLGISATPLGPIGWDYPPGRPQVLASLPGDLDVVGAAGSPLGPVALLREVERFRSDPSDPGWSLRVLTQNQWRSVQLPWDVSKVATRWPESSHVYVVNWSDTLGILVCHDDSRQADLWIGRLAPVERVVPQPRADDADGSALTSPSAANHEQAKLSVSWERVSLTLPDSFLIPPASSSVPAETKPQAQAKPQTTPDPKPVRQPDVLLGVDEAGGGLGAGDARRHLIALSWDIGGGQRVSAFALRASGPRALTVLEGVACDAAATVVHRDAQSSGVALVWIEQSRPRAAKSDRATESDQPPAHGPSLNPPATSPMSGRAGPATSRLVVREIGLSGQTFYAGPARTGERRFGREAEFLAMLLLMVMVGVVLFVIRPDAPSKVGLPESMELAGRGRRVAGAMLDYLLAAMLAALILGVPARTALIPLPLLNDEYDPRLLLLTLGLAWLHTTVFESLSGRSIGKTITGTWIMSVQRVDKVAPGPTFDSRGQPSADSGGDPAAEKASKNERGSAASDTGIAMGRPSFLACAVRNLVRWGMPVLGVFVFIDALGRHPGDLGGRTIVVQPKTVDEED